MEVRGRAAGDSLEDPNEPPLEIILDLFVVFFTASLIEGCVDSTDFKVLLLSNSLIDVLEISLLILHVLLPSLIFIDSLFIVATVDIFRLFLEFSNS